MLQRDLGPSKIGITINFTLHNFQEKKGEVVYPFIFVQAALTIFFKVENLFFTKLHCKPYPAL